MAENQVGIDIIARVDGVLAELRRLGPEGDKAGRLIDVSGLKGRAVGAASVSPTHANFLVNAGDATAADFLALMRAVRAEVKASQGVELRPEIVALGREWKDLL